MNFIQVHIPPELMGNADWSESFIKNATNPFNTQASILNVHSIIHHYPYSGHGTFYTIAYRIVIIYKFVTYC